MRIGIGQIQPGYLAPTITLVSGKFIDNPAMQAPTDADCLPYRCGADPTNIHAIEWCSMWGKIGVLGCNSPECDPVRQYLTSCTPPPVPGLPAPSPVVTIPPAAVPMLTPQNIVQPIPDIVATVAPVPETVPACSLWCDVNRAIIDNPLIAIVALGAFYMLARGKR